MPAKRASKKAPTNVGADADRIEFLTDPEDYARVAKHQWEFTIGLAERVEQGEPIKEGIEQKWVAGILRAWAQQIPLQAPGKQGPPPKIDPGALAIEFAIAVNMQGHSKNRAIEDLADKWGVSVSAVKKALSKYSAAALKMVPVKHQS